MRVENVFEKLADMILTILHNELLRDLIDKSIWNIIERKLQL